MSLIMEKTVHIDYGPGPDADFVPYYAGFEACAPGHAWRGVRDHFLIHLVLSGRGRLRLRGREQDLDGGQVFLVCPGELVRYQADARAPWTYLWFGFSGRKARETLAAAGLSEARPVARLADPAALETAIRSLAAALDEAAPAGDPLFAVAGLCRCLGVLRRDAASRPDWLRPDGSRPPAPGRDARSDRAGAYTDAVMDWVRRNYSRRARVAELAARIGLDRKYLARLCRDRLGKSPQALLTDYRLERARRLLAESDLAVAAVAASVGYADQLAFSRAFRGRCGLSPSAFRKAAAKEGI
jgi:AraC-like DNA-binding protein